MLVDSQVVPFSWDKECQNSSEERKNILTLERVLASFDLERKTRLYVYDGLMGLRATVAQKYKVKVMYHDV